MKGNIMLRILGVDIADDFSVSQHIQRLTTSAAQSMYTLRVLRNHGLGDDDLQRIYCVTFVARVIYTASAWRGFATAASRQRIDGVINRARRLGYCSDVMSTFDELCDKADDELF